MNRSPAFQFYPDEFIGGTVHMSAKEVGGYMRLLCYQWGNGRIPSDLNKAAKVAGCKMNSTILEKFPDGINKRLEKEREKQLIWREKSREGGLKSAEMRSKGGSRVVDKWLQPNGNSPSPSPSPSLSSTKKITTKLPESDKSGVVKKGGKFTLEQLDLTERFHVALNGQWENDRQKWMGRIAREEGRVDRVLREVESAIKEGRVKTSPAQYAEETWKEFL